MPGFSPMGMVKSAGQTIKSWFGGAQEGAWRGPFDGMGELGSWFQLSPHEDGWQRHLQIGYDIMQNIPAVTGAVHLHRSAGAQLRPSVNHYDENRNVSEIRNSAASRVLVNPNPYESGSEFQSRCFQYVVQDGMACIVGLRNNRFEVNQMYVIEPQKWALYMDPETRVPFVLINQDGILTKLDDASMMVPMRDVFIFKWGTSRKNPLLGESPMEAAGVSAAIYTALSRSQAAFFSNMRRPSGALITEEKLTKEQMGQLRAAFDEQAKSMQSGGIPILAGGLKWNPMSITSQDAEVIATLKMNTEEIARAVGVPPPLLGQLDNATLSNVEQLISHWMSVSLGGLIERYERGLDRLFGLDSVRDRIEMDTTALLRTDFAERMQSYGKAIQGGVMSPNECRIKEGLSPLPGGDGVFLQRQMTDVSLLTELNRAEINDTPPPNSDKDDEGKAALDDIDKKLQLALDETKSLSEKLEKEEKGNQELFDLVNLTKAKLENLQLEIAEKRFDELDSQLVEIREKLLHLDQFDELKKQLVTQDDSTDYDDETTALIVRDAIERAMSEDDQHGS